MPILRSCAKSNKGSVRRETVSYRLSGAVGVALRAPPADRVPRRQRARARGARHADAVFRHGAVGGRSSRPIHVGPRDRGRSTHAGRPGNGARPDPRGMEGPTVPVGAGVRPRALSSDGTLCGAALRPRPRRSTSHSAGMAPATAARLGAAESSRRTLPSPPPLCARCQRAPRPIRAIGGGTALADAGRGPRTRNPEFDTYGVLGDGRPFPGPRRLSPARVPHDPPPRAGGVQCPRQGQWRDFVALRGCGAGYPPSEPSPRANTCRPHRPSSS